MNGGNGRKRQVDLLIRHGMVLPMTEGMPLIIDGAVAIDGGIIAAVGPDSEVCAQYCAASEIDAAKSAVLPGFVNTHFHFMQNFLKGSRDDLDLLKWIDLVSFPRIRVVVDQYRKGVHDLHHHSAMHAGIDLLKSGITCSVNMEWAIGPSAIKAYDTVGLRVVNTLTLTDVTSWTPPDAVLSNDQYFSLSDELIECCRHSKRSEFAYGVA